MNRNDQVTLKMSPSVCTIMDTMVHCYQNHFDNTILFGQNFKITMISLSFKGKSRRCIENSNLYISDDIKHNKVWQTLFWIYIGISLSDYRNLFFEIAYASLKVYSLSLTAIWDVESTSVRFISGYVLWIRMPSVT